MISIRCAILLAFFLLPCALGAQTAIDSTARADTSAVRDDATQPGDDATRPGADGTRPDDDARIDTAAQRAGDAGTGEAAAVDSARRNLTKAQKDSLLLVMQDSLRLARDSLALAADSTVLFPVSNEVDTIITYSAQDSVIYVLDEKKMNMYEKGSIDYGATAVRAARITINWDASTIEAQGIPDTTAEGVGLVGTPVFREGTEEYTGEEMTYNFRSKEGVITKGETAIDEGFYLGERIKRVSENEYFIAGGRYTTCDNPDHKHYYFGSAQMKFVPDEIVVARPITFYVEDIPLLWLPFAVIPSSGGRSSGIMFPAFGFDPSRGRYLKNGGYYLAASDYWDLALTGDWFSKGGWLARAELRYALRYNFSGSISGSYGRQRFLIGNISRPDDQPATEWSLKIQHNQEIDPTSRITADVNIVTQSYYNSFSTNIDELLKTTARSSASYSKSWEGTNRSISVGLQREQDLLDGTSTTTLPNIRFNQSQIYPFRGDGGFGDQAWYEMIGFSYSGQFLNRIAIDEVTRFDPAVDTLSTNKERFDRRGLEHRLSLISTPKFGYFTISPSFTYTERWYDHRTERFFNEERREVEGRDVSGFFALRTFNASLSASTKLYGMFEPRALGIIGFRHTLQPSVSYSWNPDFSTESWGYYQSYTDSTGQDVRYDPYTGLSYRPGEVFGGVGSGESQTMGVRLSNIFEMKLDPLESDTTETPRKVQLFTLDASTNYNFVKDSMRLGNLNLSYRTSIQNLIELRGGATFSPYEFIPDRAVINDDGDRTVITGRETPRYAWEAGQGLGRLTSFDISLNTRLSNTMFESRDRDDEEEGMESESEDDSLRGGPIDLKAPYNFSIPWNISLGYDYRVSRFNPARENRNSNLRTNLTFSLTPSWHFTVSGYYDIVNKQLGAPSINIRKDLHCWEMDFQWVPAGTYRSFFFVIRLKAPQLKDIKLEKRGSDRGVY